MQSETSVKLVMSSQIRLIDLIHSAAEKMATVAGFDDEEALNVGLAVREAAVNAIVHGNDQNPALNVDVTLTAGSEGLEARIRDHGAGFDPDELPDPTKGNGLLAASGRGLLLIRAFVDEVAYRRKRTGMEITLTKRFKPAPNGDS